MPSEATIQAIAEATGSTKATLINIGTLEDLINSCTQIVTSPSPSTSADDERAKDISAAMGLFLHAYLRATAILILTHDIKTYMSIAMNLSTEVSALPIPEHASDLVSELFATLSKKAN